MEYINKYVWFQEGPGIRKKQYTENGVKLLNVANLINGKIDLSTSKRYISKNEAYGKYKHFLVDEGDFIIASSGIQVNYFDKKMGLITKDQLPLCMNTSTIRFKTLDKNKLDIRYFMYFMKSEQFKLQLKKLITGSAQLNFGPSHLKKVKISVPELKIQKEYISKLDNITKIIDIKNKQIMQLNQLIKSLFVEMFENKDYEKKSLNSISLGKGEYGSGAKAGDYKENLPRYVRITDINENGTLNDNFSSPLNEKKIEKYSLNYGDIIFARTGATVGKTYMYSEKDGCCIFAGFCIRFKLNTKLVNPKYIFKFTQTEKYKAWIKNKQRIVAQPNINAKEYGEELLIPIPPIELQNKFTEFVNQTDKQKFEIQNSLNKMKALYETLMNKYFG